MREQPPPFWLDEDPILQHLREAMFGKAAKRAVLVDAESLQYDPPSE